MVEDERVQTLMNLGLTLLQAKIYLALAQAGKTKIETISKASNIARQDIYRIMPTLQKLGLAEKIVTTPTMYKATPIKEGYYLLLQNKTQEYTELRKKTIAFIKNLHKSTYQVAPQQEETQFLVTSSKKLLFKRFDDRDNMAQASIDVIADWKGIKTMLFYRFQDFKRATKNGVKLRVITEKHEGDKSVQKILHTLQTNPLFEIKYLPAPIPIKTVIHDGIEVNMCIAISPSSDVPSLWSNNPQFVKVMLTYFEGLWNKALEESETPTSKNVKLKNPQTAVQQQ